jgi:hypothetical protein
LFSRAQIPRRENVTRIGSRRNQLWAGGGGPVAILSGVSLITKTKYVFNPELREMRNQTMLFVFGL